MSWLSAGFSSHTKLDDTTLEAEAAEDRLALRALHALSALNKFNIQSEPLQIQAAHYVWALSPKSALYGEARTGWRQQRARMPTQETFSLRVAVLFALAGCQPHRARGSLPRRNLAKSWILPDSRNACKALASQATFA